MASSKVENRITKLEANTESIKTALVAIDAKLDGLDHVIRGNGSPGVAAKVSAVQEDLAELKAGKDRVREALYAAYGGLGVGIILYVVQHIWK